MHTSPSVCTQDFVKHLAVIHFQIQQKAAEMKIIASLQISYFCSLLVFFGSFTYGTDNLKHMRLFDLLSAGALPFPRVCIFSGLCTYTVYECVHVHRCTEKEGGTRGLRHIVLITIPISKKTYPFPICCLLPVKIFFLSTITTCNPSQVEGEVFVIRNVWRFKQQVGHRGHPAVKGQRSLNLNISRLIVPRQSKVWPDG